MSEQSMPLTQTGKNPFLSSSAIIFFCWILFGALLVVRTLFVADSQPLFSDSDDAMRMVTVLDLLNGQNWFDDNQARLNTPFGASVHWSRLIDLPLAGLVWAASQFVEQSQAIIIASYIWPTALLLVLLFLSVAVCKRFMAPFEAKQALLPGIVLPMVSFALILDFEPGSIDHHNVQILLTLGLLLTTIDGRRHIFAAFIAGFLCATSIAIGLETIIFVAASIIVFGLYFVFLGKQAQIGMLVFGTSFFMFTIGHLFLAHGQAGLSDTHCDAISAVYGVAAALVAAAFALSFRLAFGLDSALKRFIILALLGGFVLAGLIYLFPQCLGGPYWNLSEFLKTRWLAYINEAQPLIQNLQIDFTTTVGFVLVPIIAMVIVIKRALTGDWEQRAPWLVLSLFLGLAVIVMLFQVRGARLAAPLTLPAGAYLIVAARQAYYRTKAPQMILGLVLAWLAFTGPAHVGAAHLVNKHILKGAPKPGVQVAAGNGQASGDPMQCFREVEFEKLASMDTTKLMTPIFLGAHVLLYSPHSIVAAPYHRNQMGMTDWLHFIDGPQLQAQLIAKNRGLTHFVTCKNLPEAKFAKNWAEKGSVGYVLASGEMPSWFTSLSEPEDNLQIYALNW